MRFLDRAWIKVPDFQPGVIEATSFVVSLEALITERYVRMYISPSKLCQFLRSGPTVRLLQRCHEYGHARVCPVPWCSVLLLLAAMLLYASKHLKFKNVEHLLIFYIKMMSNRFSTFNVHFCIFFFTYEYSDDPSGYRTRNRAV